MTFYPELKGRPLDAFAKTEDILVAKATAQLGLARPDIIVRPLLPEDINAALNSWTFSVTSTSGLNTMVNNQTIADNRFVSINGICDPNAIQCVDVLRITRSGSVVREWDIEAIMHQEGNTMWVDDPFTVDQNTTITIQGYNDSTSTNALYNLIFLGLVAEKRGMLINP